MFGDVNLFQANFNFSSVRARAFTVPGGLWIWNDSPVIHFPRSCFF